MEPALCFVAEAVVAMDESLIQRIVRRVLSVTQPDRIILFGSAATGNMTRDSDIDLLVLAPCRDKARQERTRIADALRGLGFAFDVIVMPVERFEETKNVIGGIAYPANKYGKVIYEAS
ncbi:MAG: nucleotidyltransferase domain-containing protein [Armatimonadota bacterium]